MKRICNMKKRTNRVMAMGIVKVIIIMVVMEIMAWIVERQMAGR